MLIFFLIALVVLGILHGYPAYRIIPTLGLSAAWQTTIWIAVAALAILPLMPLILRSSGFENRFMDSLAWVGFTSQGFFFLFFVAVLLRDLGWISLTAGSEIVQWIRNLSSTVGSDAVGFDPGRRQFLIWAMNVGIVSTTGGLSLYGLFQARRKATLVEIDVPIANLPEGLEGFRIAQISDLHVGPTIKRDYVQRVVDQVNALDADLVALTGDLVDGSVDYLSNDVAPIAELKAKYGRYFVTGNHEYYSGADHWVAEIDRLGFTCLMNQHEVLEIDGAKLTVGGVTDLHAHQVMEEHRTDPAAAFDGSPDDAVKLLLAHQPGSINAAQKVGVDLQISGHTHGGQLKPFDKAVALTHQYVSGLHNHEGSWIYVNSGTGYWGPPIRLGVPSEISVLRLTRA